MSEIPHLTGKFRTASRRKQPAEERGEIRRQRPSLVCDQCRVSKLRCDKARPCGSCVKRNGGTSCSYDQRPRGSDRQATEHRLKHLEAMVNQLLEVPNASRSLQDPVSPPSSADDQAHVNGGHEVGMLKDQYPTVVEEIMDTIRQLHLELPTTNDGHGLEESMSDARRTEDDCIFGLASSYSQHAILSQYMPSEKEADHLLATYFRGDAFIQPFIHTQNFQRQYHTFRENRFHTASALWLSILFSIFSIASLAQEAVYAEPNAQIKSRRFHTAAGQCLVLGRYHNTQRDAPEALLLYAHYKSLKSLDPSHETGAIISMAVRHAYELGYHRDPDTFGKFTLFEGEMRRRFWACCKQVDTMMSFQLGLPSNINFDNCDTRSPLNLLDSDFDIETQQLPEPRPDSEATPIL